MQFSFRLLIIILISRIKTQEYSSSYQRKTSVSHQSIPSYGPSPNQQNYNRYNSEHSARFRAEQQRLAEIRRKQQKFSQQQRAREQRQKQRITKTQQIHQKQLQEVRTLEKNYVPLKTVLFETDSLVSQFQLSPMENVQIILKIKIYILQGHVYGVIKDVNKVKPVKIYVYEDNTGSVAQGQFYFQKYVVFQAKPKSLYTIHIQSDGESRLIQLQYPDLLQQSHIAHLYPEEYKKSHDWKIIILLSRMKEVTQKLRRNSFMQTVNSQTFINNLKKYSIYQITEMGIIIAVAILQVNFLQKLLRTDTIL